MQKANFDSSAATYDIDFTQTIVGKLQRKRVWKHLVHAVSGTKGILEINCGTGYDARQLVEMGHEVIATDISAAMIEVARKNVHHPALQFQVCGFHQLADQFPPQHTQLIFSNFAGVNCIDAHQLKQLNTDLANLLQEKGKWIVVVFGKKCWIERLYFTLRGEYDKAKRRSQPAEVSLVGGHKQPAYYYSVRELKALFRSFQLIKVKPIGLCIPPSYLNPILQRYGFLIPFIQLAETLVGNISWLANYADHVYLEFKKK